MSLLVGLVLMSMASAPIEKQVEFTGAGGFLLYGTLTLPANAVDHKAPGVILLPGSGPTDRNGNQPPNLITDVLKQISDELAKNGIATLRFDKRATRLYIPKFPKDRAEWAEFFKWENFVDDATGAFRYLGSQPGVDPKRVAIIGHSEGAELAFQIGSNLANDPTPPAAIVTIGGTGRPMGPVIREQIEFRLNQQKVLPPTKKVYMDYVDKALAQVKQDSTFPPNPPAGLEGLFNITVTKLMHTWCILDPTTLARNYKGPVLLINGADDQQVSPVRDTPLLKAALQERKSGTVQMEIVPDASHNLKSTTAGNKDAFTGPVAPLAMSTITQFLTKELHP